MFPMRENDRLSFTVYGFQLDDVFLEFNPKPHGVASLAQVHEARLRENGEKVAVKIQHPKVKSRSVVDIATMEVGNRGHCITEPASSSLYWSKLIELMVQFSWVKTRSSTLNTLTNRTIQ